MELSVFEDGRLIAAGGPGDVAAAMQAAHARQSSTLALDTTTGEVVDLDLRGSPADVAARYRETPRRGRPRLGVKAREVTLLPRHWEWLSGQRGGASATLRRLVQDAMRTDTSNATAARDAAYRAATALAGDLPGYEEAIRALYAGDLNRVAAAASAWPADIRRFVLKLARGEPL